MCQKPYERTALSQNLQPISPAMMPPSSQLLPTQMFKSSKSEIDLLSQEKTPPFDADQDPVLADLCRPLHCKLCNVSLNSTQQAQAHYQGKNHSKKLRNYYAGHQCVSASKMTHPVDQPSTQLIPPASQSGSSKTTSRVILATANDYCKLCDASFSSPAVAQAHYQGKNHAKRLRLAEAQKSNSLSQGDRSSRSRRSKRPYRAIEAPVSGRSELPCRGDRNSRVGAIGTPASGWSKLLRLKFPKLVSNLRLRC
ncbi:zinc finger matrin-type protein 3 isoform X2 [Leucoraja erinacea]|uniref:zinc finger matrin-type protein 3 isoform X2 n=1 Tax=Leucoraja erinaceus TaxID=7782 RepID=UPI002457D804|nr:zinc finger matrin-type protein 3 isoform X2 [Leucoraja erinacea]